MSLHHMTFVLLFYFVFLDKYKMYNMCQMYKMGLEALLIFDGVSDQNRYLKSCVYVFAHS